MLDNERFRRQKLVLGSAFLALGAAAIGDWFNDYQQHSHNIPLVLRNNSLDGQHPTSTDLSVARIVPRYRFRGNTKGVVCCALLNRPRKTYANYCMQAYDPQIWAL
jgi:hypothetical protein